MPSIWVSLWKSLNCKTEPSHVHDPRNQIKSITLKDLISHSKRHNTKRQSGGSSPKSVASSKILNPMTHEVVTVNESTWEFQISGFGHKKGGSFRGTLKRKGTPGNGSLSARISNSKVPSGYRYNVGNFVNSKGFHDRGCYINGSSYLKDSEAVEEHHHFHHSVTELSEGDSSRKIVELICGSNLSPQIETVLQVNNSGITLSQFEDHRAAVKTRATSHHPRCTADGNELLRFHAATVACSLGRNGHARPCTLRGCGVCNILTRGFSISAHKHGGFGVFTACRSERALEMAGGGGDDQSARRALVVCRVIAGRVRRAVEGCEEEKVNMGLEGFDSLAGGLGHDHDHHESKSVDELYLLHPRALLACFVVICRDIRFLKIN